MPWGPVAVTQNHLLESVGQVRAELARHGAPYSQPSLPRIPQLIVLKATKWSKKINRDAFPP